MISIIGAGPVGNYLAYLLAKQGHDVQVFEEHKEIGIPIQCTGIMTSSIMKMVQLDDSFVVNIINRTKVFSPDGNYVDIPLRENVIVDRTKFDAHIAKLAKQEGVVYHLNKRFKSCEQGKSIVMHFTDGSNYETDYLIGCDGPFSQVAKSVGIYGKRKFSLGVQARVQLEQDSNLVEFFLEKDYIGWSVPEEPGVVRLGIASLSKGRACFEDLLAKRNGKILDWQSGPIPVYDPQLQTQKDNVYLVGDAAMMVKATTYGGIIQGMQAAEAFVETFGTKKSYAQAWKKKLGRDLWLHLKVRKVMDKFTEQDLNTFVAYTKQPRIKHILETYDRDFITKIILLSLLKEPRFLRFAKLGVLFAS